MPVWLSHALSFSRREVFKLRYFKRGNTFVMPPLNAIGVTMKPKPKPKPKPKRSLWISAQGVQSNEKHCYKKPMKRGCNAILPYDPRWPIGGRGFMLNSRAKCDEVKWRWT